MRPVVLASRGVVRNAEKSFLRPWEWPKCSWEAKDLVENVQSQVKSKVSENRWFMYNESRAVNAKLLEDEEDTVHNMAINDMVESICDPGSGRFAYFTSPLQQLCPERFEKIRSHWTKSSSVHAAVWLSSYRAGTRAHYDVFDNEFVQLHGSKRLRVWRPLCHTAMHVFPDSHPRARKSQVDVDQKSPTFPLFETLEPPVLDMVLNAGDSVFIPAFWFHELQVESPYSVSVNGFLPSIVTMQANRIFARPLPRSMTESELAQMVWRLVTGVWGSGQGERFLVNILRSRFEPLGLVIATCESSGGFSVEYEAHLTAFLEDVASLRSVLKHSDAGADVDGVVELVLAHLVELWVVSSTGKAQSIPAVINLALNQCQNRK